MRFEFLLPSLIAATLFSSLHLPSRDVASQSPASQDPVMLAQHSSPKAYRGSGRRDGTALVTVGTQSV